MTSDENLPLVGKLLNNRRHSTTASYDHIAVEHLVTAAEKVVIIIARVMLVDTLGRSSNALAQ